eukprot:Hpha_TRINITY_DN32729_c0_g1::TRINITY_DN32729_c0_g1_i1::g.69235::m.69235
MEEDQRGPAAISAPRPPQAVAVLCAAEAAAFGLAVRLVLLHHGKRIADPAVSLDTAPEDLSEADVVRLRERWCLLGQEQREQECASCAADLMVEAKAAKRQFSGVEAEALAGMQGLAHVSHGDFHIVGYQPWGAIYIGSGSTVGKLRALLVRCLPERDPRDMFEGVCPVGVTCCHF